MRRAYTYSVIRFVPNSTNGEAVNIGVIVGSHQTGEWVLRRVGRLWRAGWLAGERKQKVLPRVAEYLTRIELALDSFTFREKDPHPFVDPGKEEWLRTLSQDAQSGEVRFSPPLPLLAEGVDAAVDYVWRDFIIEASPVTPGSALPVGPAM